jgi:hypothetical protein
VNFGPLPQMYGASPDLPNPNGASLCDAITRLYTRNLDAAIRCNVDPYLEITWPKGDLISSSLIGDHREPSPSSHRHNF